MLLLSREVGDLKSVRLPLTLISETILSHCIGAPLVTLRSFIPLRGGGGRGTSGKEERIKSARPSNWPEMI